MLTRFPNVAYVPASGDGCIICDASDLTAQELMATIFALVYICVALGLLILVPAATFSALFSYFVASTFSFLVDYPYIKSFENMSSYNTLSNIFTVHFIQIHLTKEICTFQKINAAFLDVKGVELGMPVTIHGVISVNPLNGVKQICVRDGEIPSASPYSVPGEAVEDIIEKLVQSTPIPVTKMIDTIRSLFNSYFPAEAEGAGML